MIHKSLINCYFLIEIEHPILTLLKYKYNENTTPEFQNNKLNLTLKKVNEAFDYFNNETQI